MKLFKTSQQIGIGFDDMKMGILRFGIVGIEFRESHISHLTPLSRTSFDIAIMLAIEGMHLNAVV